MLGFLFYIYPETKHLLLISLARVIQSFPNSLPIVPKDAVQWSFALHKIKLWHGDSFLAARNQSITEKRPTIQSVSIHFIKENPSPSFTLITINFYIYPRQRVWHLRLQLRKNFLIIKYYIKENLLRHYLQKKIPHSHFLLSHSYLKIQNNQTIFLY